MEGRPLAGRVAVGTLRNATTGVEVIRLVAFDEATYQAYLARLAQA